VENKKALKLIEKIQKDISEKGIEIDQLVSDLLELRTYAIDEKIPRLAKCLRLTCEHLNEYEGFFIPQPDDELVDEDGEVIGIIESANDSDVNSLLYLLSIMRDPHNKINHEEIGEYVAALKEYAAEN
jgi:hypothetical protein